MTAVTIDHDSCTNTTATFRHIPHMQERIKHTFMHTQTYTVSKYCLYVDLKDLKEQQQTVCTPHLCKMIHNDYTCHLNSKEEILFLPAFTLLRVTSVPSGMLSGRMDTVMGRLASLLTK